MLPTHRPLQSEESPSGPTAPTHVPPATEPAKAPVARHRRHRISGAVVGTATKLLPLMALLDSLQPHVSSESVFRTRRKKLMAHLAEVYKELHAPRPRREVLTHTLHAMAELVRDELKDISKDELKQAAKELVLATLQNAPGLISAAHQARLLS